MRGHIIKIQAFLINSKGRNFINLLYFTMTCFGNLLWALSFLVQEKEKKRIFGFAVFMFLFDYRMFSSIDAFELYGITVVFVLLFQQPDLSEPDLYCM